MIRLTQDTEICTEHTLDISPTARLVRTKWAHSPPDLELVHDNPQEDPWYGNEPIRYTLSPEDVGELIGLLSSYLAEMKRDYS